MRRRPLILVLVLAGALLGTPPAQSEEFPPQAARGVVTPVGFTARPFAQLPPGLLPTSLAWGESTTAGATDGALHGTKLYVTTITGEVLAYEDEGIAPTVAATGLAQPLGVVVGPDKTVYVSENANNRGRVTALNDTNGDGTFETKRTVISSLPNGRHQTNGLTFGADGFLYVANGNATDDGVECGPAPVPGGSEDDCPAPEVVPWSGSILRVNPEWTGVDLLDDIRIDDDGVRADDGMDIDSVLVATGFRNIYDVDFDPLQPDDIWTPMNGSDNPSSSEPLYGLSVTDERVAGADADGNPVFGPRIEDAGFPSCLYDAHANTFPLPQAAGGHDHPGDPEPQDNPNQRVIEQFGPCDAGNVLRPKSIFAEGHEGTSGSAFVRGSNFPERYRGDLFVAEWGSLWNLNGGTVTGHKIIHLDLDQDRNVVGQREFMSGVLPMDVTFGPNGFLYVADMTGQIYEVSHVVDAPDVVTVSMVEANGICQFVPQVATVIRGQAVRWVNDSCGPQNIRGEAKVRVVDPRGSQPAVQSGREIDSPGDIPRGGSHSYTFGGETAVYNYYSTTTGLGSNTTRGTVVVTPAER